MTTRNFQDMLNEFLPDKLLKEEHIKRDYITSKVGRDDGWKGGTRPVPFRGARPSTVQFGSLAAASDIAQGNRVRGSISGYREAWGSLLFDQRDLMEHDGKIPETTFLDLLADELEEHADYFKEVASVQLGSGPHFATLTSDGTAGGAMAVDNIERFEIGQKFTLVDDNTAAAEYYVTALNQNTDTATVSATRGGAAADISAFATAQNAKVYHPGVYDGGGNHDTFISMRQAFLSAANGGLAALHGQTKTSYPILQSINVDGSGWSTSNILESIFNAMTDGRKRGKGGMYTHVLMDLTAYGAVLKLLETWKGAYRVVEDENASVYGWYEMKIANVTGQTLTLVGIQEWDSDIICGVDWRSFQFLTNGYFRKRKSPEGQEYFEVRNTTGFQYIVDTCLFGEMEYKRAGHNWIAHSISL